jgi:hypothetical protein
VLETLRVEQRELALERGLRNSFGVIGTAN